MINAGDLHIDEEIRPLFDFTHNSLSGEDVKNILASTLNSKEEIFFRQDLLMGFIANWEILKSYSYSRFNLSEIHDFFGTIFLGSVSTKKLRFRLMFSE